MMMVDDHELFKGLVKDICNKFTLNKRDAEYLQSYYGPTYFHLLCKSPTSLTRILAILSEDKMKNDEQVIQLKALIEKYRTKHTSS